MGNIRDSAYIWFDADAITIARGLVSFVVGVEGAEESTPFRIPRSCVVCADVPATAEAHTRLVKRRATAGGPGPDVRVVARRRWGDDFTGCSTCNNNGPVPLVYPTIVLSTNAESLSSGQTATITATVSAPAIGFAIDDIIAQGGSISNLQQTGPLTYTFVFTAGGGDDATIYVPANSFVNSSGIPNVVSNVLSITITGPPTVVLTSNKSSLAAGETATITATVSEPVYGFGTDDVTVTGGTTSNFSQTTTLNYTFTFTPESSQTSFTATIVIPANKFVNIDSIPNLASNTLNISVAGLGT